MRISSACIVGYHFTSKTTNGAGLVPSAEGSVMLTHQVKDQNNHTFFGIEYQNLHTFICRFLQAKRNVLRSTQTERPAQRGCYVPTWLLLWLSLSTACGQTPPGVSTQSLGGPSAQSTTSINTYRIELSGDNVQFTLSFFTDLNEPTEQQLVVTTTTIGVGQTISYDVQGYASETNSGVSRVGGINVANGGAWLQIKVYKNGTLVRTSSLSDAGNYDGFPVW